MQVISAITYQIIPSDKLYAEVPLAAVSSIYQLQVLACLVVLRLYCCISSLMQSFVKLVGRLECFVLAS